MAELADHPHKTTSLVLLQFLLVAITISKATIFYTHTHYNFSSISDREFLSATMGIQVIFSTPHL